MQRRVQQSSGEGGCRRGQAAHVPATVDPPGVAQTSSIRSWLSAKGHMFRVAHEGAIGMVSRGMMRTASGVLTKMTPL